MNIEHQTQSCECGPSCACNPCKCGENCKCGTACACDNEGATACNCAK